MNRAFGPGATAMNREVNPQLSTFWRRRLTRLPTLSRSNPAMTRPTVAAIVVTALAIGLMPTLYGPAASAEAGKAIAAAQPDRKQPSENAAKKMPLPAAAAQGDAEGVDLSFVSATANGFVAARPAAALEHLAQAPWAKRWCASIGSPEFPIGDFRQATFVGVQLRAHEGNLTSLDFGSVIVQSLRPFDVAPLLRLVTSERKSQLAVKDYDGRKLYVCPKSNGTVDGVLLCYDDRTSILTHSQDSLRAYLPGKRGALPPWLPAEVWKGFRGDDLMLALDSSVLQQGWNLDSKQRPAEHASHLSFAPLYQDVRFILAGLRLGDPVRVHAVATARDEQGATQVEKAAMAARVLGLSAIQAARAASAKRKAKADPDEVWMAALGESILAAMRFRREGTVLHMESSLPLATLHDLIASSGTVPEASAKSARRSDDRQDKR
jgi:hypothetical protein